MYVEPSRIGHGKTTAVDSILPLPEDVCPWDSLSYELFQKVISILGQDICGKIDGLTAELCSSIVSLKKRIDGHNEVLTKLSQKTSSHRRYSQDGVVSTHAPS